ncbi:MAG: hypothetical protein K9K81_03120 [Desulfobacteraceae bacterium]|nr:hypothetical protein [Desulfobacteraceae bacterium]
MYKRIFVLLCWFLILSLSAVHAGGAGVHLITPDSQDDIIKNIKVSDDSFNPSVDEKIHINYELVRPAKTTLRIFGPDHERIAEPLKDKQQKTGKHRIPWDGRDIDGDIVPDEAYFFTITARDEEKEIKYVYDPCVFSGGIEQDLSKASINDQAGTIEYRLSEMARVRIRLGISGGPLLYTLVDWEPRTAGRVTEYWDGWDKDHLIRLRRHPRFKMIISRLSLPENSLIAYGNKQTDYFVYSRKISRPEKKEHEPPPADSDRNVSFHAQIPRIKDRSPEVIMTFPQKTRTEDGAAVLMGKTMVRVELGDQYKEFFREMKYEICFFLDGEFYAEEEAGYSPYNWLWDTSRIEPGTYILTVNLASFKDQIGILSKKIKVNNKEVK